MKRNLVYATSILALAAFATPSFAESPAQSGDADATGQTQINPGVQQLNTDQGTTASTSPADMTTVTTLMGEGTTTAGQIGTITEVSTVNVVRVDDWADAEKQAFDAAMSQNMQPIKDLRAAISGNTALTAALDAQQVQPAEVVASQINADGSVTVYVRSGA
jgi:hypothetical protein